MPGPLPPKDELPLFMTLDEKNHMEKPVEPVITGDVPNWLTGSLYRNGSGIYHMGNDSWNHLFDGFAVIHRWTVHDGKVTFQQSILDSDHYKKCVKHNRLIGQNFGAYFPDPCKSVFSKFFSYFIPQPPGKSDNTGVNVVEFGDRLFAMTETPSINELTPESLNVKEKYELTNALTVHMGTAHPLKSLDGKYMYYYGTHMNARQAYNFVSIPLSNDASNPFAGAKVVGRIPSRWKMNISYTHSFGITENYFVHLEQPMTLNLPKMATLSVRGSAISEAIICHENEPMHFILVHKETGEKVPIKYFAPHGFVFHFANCYEENGQVIADMALFDNGKVIKSAYLDSIVKCLDPSKKAEVLPDAVFARFVMPLSVKDAKEDVNLVTVPGSSATAKLRKGTTDTLDITADFLFDASYNFELPRINDDYTGRKHRYVYGGTALSCGVRRLMKFDCENKEVKDWISDDDHCPGECIFAPRPGATAEDDGVIMCPVISQKANVPSFLVMLDAASFKEIARATVPADQKVSFTFHGFFSNKKSVHVP